ncbi:hypothetical protein ACWGF3_14865 [Streptomyces xanthophaeus]
MSTVDDWKNSSVSEGSIVRVNQREGTEIERLEPYVGFLCARVRKLDYEAGTVRLTVCEQETAEPLRGDAVLRDDPKPSARSARLQKWLQEQGVTMRGKLTVTVDFADLDLLKVIEEDEWPWNGVYVGDRVGFAAPPLGANTGALWQGTVVGLDTAEQIMSVEILLTDGHVEKFLMSRVTMHDNVGPH